MTTTVRWGLAELAAAQAQPHLTLNTNLEDMDVLLGTISVISITNTPPGSPAQGDTYIAGTSPTGAWSLANRIFYWSGTAWRDFIPRKGILVYVDSGPPKYWYWSGTAWTVTGLI